MKLKMINNLLSPFLACSLTTAAMLATVTASAQDAPPTEIAPVPVPELPPVAQPVADPESVLHDRQHHIVLDSNGGFTGQLVALDSGDGKTNPVGGMNVTILHRGGVVASAVSNADGTFNVSGVGEGVVSVVGTGKNHFLLFSVRLISEGNSAFGDATPVSLKTKAVQAETHTAVVRSSDVSVIKQLILGALPTGDYRFTSELTEPEHQYPYGTNETSTSLSHHTVQLQPDGTLVGEVNLLDARSGRHREIVDLTLHFVKDGQHVGATAVQTDGRFHMAGLAPGRYSIATTGRDGILAMGIEVVGALANVQKEDEFRLTSIVQEVLELCVCPALPGDCNAQNAEQSCGEIVEGEIVGEEMFGAPFGGPAGGPLGTSGGGFSGGGGGGGIGGGGGLGALLGAAAAGAIGFAVGNDDGAASPSR